MDKIGYTYDEILDFMTEGEGRDFLGRSMYDAIRETIEEKDKEIERLSKEVTKYDEILCERNNEVDRLNNIIKRIKDHFVFLKINSNGGNKEFFEDIIEMIEVMEELKEGKE